jgi:hypothetical protein
MLTLPLPYDDISLHYSIGYDDALASSARRRGADLQVGEGIVSGLQSLSQGQPGAQLGWLVNRPSVNQIW